MATFDLNVDAKLQRSLSKANTAFSSVEYPSVAEVIDILVRHRIACLFEETFDGVKYGDTTLRRVFLEPYPDEGDFVVLLTGPEIHSLAYRFWENGDAPYRRKRVEMVLEIVQALLTVLGLHKALTDIGVKVALSMGLKPEEDVIIFDRI